MEGFCRGCLIRYDEPSELLPYTEKNRRLFIYSTGIQVKRDEFETFQLCKDCHVNMKLSCKFKKQCRTSDKKYKHYLSLKEVGDAFDLTSFLRSNDESLRFSLLSGNSTPANRVAVSERDRDDDNVSTCTSIRNFMTDILQGEEMPDAEANIIKEVIEEETGLLEDTLDSQWLQDEISRDSDFRDLSFSPFTPRSIQIDHCYTPNKQVETSIADYNNISHQNIQLTDYISKFDGPVTNTEEVEVCTVQTTTENAIKAETDVTNEPDILFDEIIDQNVTYTQNENDIVVTDTDYNVIHNESYYAAKALQKEYEQNQTEANHVQDQLAVKHLLELNHNNDVDFNNSDKNNDASHNTILGKNIDINQVPSEGNEISYTLQLESKVLDKDRNENQTEDDQNLELFTTQVDSKKINHDEKLNDNIKIEPEHEYDIDVQKKDYVVEEQKTESNQDIILDDLLISPAECRLAPGASTPMINNILFGEKLEPEDEEDKHSNKSQKEEIDVLDQMLNQGVKEFSIHSKDSQAEDIYDLDKHYCKTCNKKFKSLKALKIHLNKIHGIKLPETRTRDFDTRTRVCNQCGATLNNFQKYQRHMRTHSDAKIECPICKIEFTSHYRLKVHMKSHRAGQNHEDEKNESRKFVCSMCGKLFKTSAGLSLHTKRHLKNYLVSCEECGMGFYRKTDLEGHMRVHRGERPFECKFCDFKFSAKYSLVKHMKIHLGEKPFECEICSAKFVLKADVLRHLKTSSKCLRTRAGLAPTKPPPSKYQCAYCSDMFTNKREFIKHQKKYNPCATLQAGGLSGDLIATKEPSDSEIQDVDMTEEI